MILPAAHEDTSVSDASAPAITVIVPAYNRSAVMRLALRSLLDQESTDFEALVIGDGCTDDSEAVVAAFGDPRLRWRNLSANTGSSAGPINAGVAQAAAPLIAILMQDDIWLPWHLRTQVETLEATGADFVHSIVPELGERGVTIAYGGIGPAMTYGAHRAPPSSWLVRRAVFDAVGPWLHPREVAVPHDMNFLHRVAQGGHRIVCTPQVTIVRFPSADKPGLYGAARNDLALQERTLARIAADPVALELDLTRQIADFALADLSQRDFLAARLPPPTAAKRLVGATGRWLMRRYGEERWPIQAWRRRTNRRWYGDRNQRRGLGRDHAS